MHPKQKDPDKIICVGGVEFRLYKYYEELSGEYILAYPDFEETPQYTAEGRPFALRVDEGCPSGDSGDAQNPDPGGCGGCVHFYREHSPHDPIGVCMCEERRVAAGEETGKRKGGDGD